MSLIVVPLAGPDFYTKRFGIRPLYPFGKSTLLQHVLSMRFWISGVTEGRNRLVFVLRELTPHTAVMIDFIKHHYPDAHTVVLDSITAGAPLSALAGVSLLNAPEEPVIVDLVDIYFDWGFDADNYFSANEQVDAVVPYFISTDAKFSYLVLDGTRVVKSREKQCISENASAGIYIFRNAVAYLRAVVYCIENPEICRVGSALFVCPTVNGIIEGGRDVAAFRVENVVPISVIFHMDEIGGRL